MDKIRTFRLDDIQMPVIVEHGDMEIGDEERIDRLASRVDTLAMSAFVKYRGGALKRGRTRSTRS